MIKRRDKIKKMCIIPEEINNVLSGLSIGFDWDQTREGGEYWRKIYSRLLEIGEKEEY